MEVGAAGEQSRASAGFAAVPGRGERLDEGSGKGKGKEKEGASAGVPAQCPLTSSRLVAASARCVLCSRKATEEREGWNKVVLLVMDS